MPFMLAQKYAQPWAIMTAWVTFMAWPHDAYLTYPAR